MTFFTPEGKTVIAGDAPSQAICLGNRWICLPDEISIMALGREHSFIIQTSANRNHTFETLRAEKLYYPLMQERAVYQPQQIIFETAVLITLGLTPEETDKRYAALKAAKLALPSTDVIGWTLELDGQKWRVVFNFSDASYHQGAIGIPTLDPVATSVARV